MGSSYSHESTEYQDDTPSGGMNKLGSKHTIRFDPQGNVWSTGFPLTRLDPKTGKFTDFGDASPIAYGIAPDKEGNIWFTGIFPEKASSEESMRRPGQ